MSVMTTALSGLTAAQATMAAAASNVANATTAGYRPVEAVTTAGPGGAVLTGFRPSVPQGLGGVSLDQEMVSMVTAKTAYAASATLVRAADEMASDLLDMVG